MKVPGQKQAPVWMAMLAIVATGSVRAGTNVWTPMGPFGGSARALAIDPRDAATVYTGASGGIFKTTSGGANWSPVNSGLPAGYIARALAVDPSNSNIVYAAGACGPYGPCGIFKSTDAGANWSAINSGLDAVIVVDSLAIDPQNTGTLYAGGSACLQDSCFNPAVFKTTDGGASWSAAASGLPYADSTTVHSLGTAGSLAIDPRNTSTLYAGVRACVQDSCSSSGVFKSTDGGLSWSPAQSGLPCCGALALAIDAQNPNTVYAGTWGRLFKTTNGGASWSAADSGLQSDCCGSLAIDPLNPNAVYVGGYYGVFRSVDGGRSWANAGLPSWTGAGPITFAIDPPNPSAGLAVDPQNSGTVYAATPGLGIFKSTDWAQSWSAVNSGLSATEVITSAIDPRDPDTIYAATTSGLLKTTDGGASWSAADSGLPTGFANGNRPTVRELAIDPQTASTIYAVIPRGSAYQPGGIFKSMDGGATWSSLSLGASPAPDVAFFAGPLVIDPQDSSTLFAAGDLAGGVPNPWGLFKSSDAGKTWTHTSFGNTATALAFDPQNPGTVYAGVIWQILKSADGGASWNELPLPQGFVPEDCEEGCLPANVLAVDPQAPDTLYAGGTTGLWKSTDGGASWNLVTAGLPSSVSSPNVTALLIDPRDSENLYAAISGRVFRSTDGAAHWSEVKAGLTVTSINSLMINPKDPSTIYVATAGGGLFTITFSE